MTRRDALKTMFAASLAAFIEPAKRRAINLKEFCSATHGSVYDMRLPYVMEDWTYATDSKMCVRVRPELGDVATHTGKIPPFGNLKWNHDRGGWRTLPKRDPIMAAESWCLECDGSGYAGGVIADECDHCKGTGTEWWDRDRINGPCVKCKGRGHYAPAKLCWTCKGKGYGTFQALVELDGQFFNAKLYGKAQRLGCEYSMDEMSGDNVKLHPLIKFRFDGGDGLLLGFERDLARKRIMEARA